MNKKSTLFPELAPYGQIKPTPSKTVKTETEEPITYSRPVMTAAPTSVVQVPKAYRSYRKLLFLLAALVTILGTAALSYALIDHGDNKPTTNSSVQQTQTQPAASQVSIELYYPKNLPKGFTFNNDGNVIKKDVYFYSISGPHKAVFSITQQPIPISFDFVAFNKKFLSPDNFNTNAGTVTAGPVGAAMLGSVRTNKNTWILINAPSTVTLGELESVIRSFELSQ